jgi:phosphoglycolate phosphatase
VLTPAPDAAVFDFDGVVIDSRVAVRSAVNETLVQHGFPPRPADVLDRFIGPPVLAAFAELTGEAEDSELVAACAATYHERYASVYLEKTSLVDGIGAVLAELTLPLALATAKPFEFVTPLLESLSIAGRFRCVFAPSMSALDERKTVTVAKALNALGAASAAVVGDRSFDVEAAHANGVRAIGVTWGIGDRGELHTAGADVIVERPVELLELLQPRYPSR